MDTVHDPASGPQPDLIELLFPQPMPDHLALPFALAAGSYRDVRVLMRDGHVVGVRGPRWALKEMKLEIEQRARAEARR